MATREEKHSTRGRAHLLWEMMQGNVLEYEWRNEEVKEALDLCLSCKACKTECPVNVDMATWKSEFLAHYHEGHLHPLRDYAFGFMDKWARLASAAPALANLPLRIPGVTGVVKRVLGVAQERELPAFARRSFRAGFSGVAGDGNGVLLWPDTWNNYFQPEALDAAAKVLTAAGNRVEIPKKHVCCGRPLYDFGFLDEARAYLVRILDEFEQQIMAGLPVVMLEPSCASVFRDELINFFPQDERAVRLSKQTVMLSEMLSRSANGWTPPRLDGRRVIVQGHCHQKALLTMKDEVSLLRATGATVEVLDSGCCGMAGPFGFEAEKFAVSQTLAERVLLPAVRGARADDVLVANGFSCREQIKQNTPRRAVHLAQVMAGIAKG
jgi:Fe-S oxidoreductase